MTRSFAGAAIASVLLVLTGHVQAQLPPPPVPEKLPPAPKAIRLDPPKTVPDIKSVLATGNPIAASEQNEKKAPAAPAEAKSSAAPDRHESNASAHDAAKDMMPPERSVLAKTAQVPEEEPEQMHKTRSGHVVRLNISKRSSLVNDAEKVDAGGSRLKASDYRAHKYRKPSHMFLAFFKPWQFRIGRVELLHDTVEDLLRHNPECGVIRTEVRDTETGRTAPREILSCPNPTAFGADGDTVEFDYLRSNDVITGARYHFNDKLKARAFTKLVVREISRKTKESIYEDNAGELWDSPMFWISLEGQGKGADLAVHMYYSREAEDFENYARQNLTRIRFGSIEIGKTLIANLSAPDLKKAKADRTHRLPECVSRPPEKGYNEFYGKCFDFPYRGHFLIGHDDRSGAVSSLVLTVLDTPAAPIIESGLTSRYGKPARCSETGTGLWTASPSGFLNERSLSRNLVRAAGKPALVWAGSCENPVVFAVADSYLFRFDALTIARINAEYKNRKQSSEVLSRYREKVQGQMGNLGRFF